MYEGRVYGFAVIFLTKKGKKASKTTCKNRITDYIIYQTLRGGAVVARQAHNLKAVGSIPAPATNRIFNRLKRRFFCAQIAPFSLFSDTFINLVAG